MYRKTLLTTALLAGIASLTGCTSHPEAAELNVHREQSGVAYTATFDRAVFTQSALGTVDLILLQNSAADPSVDHPLAGDGNGGVQQVVHVKVLWQPTRTIRLDSPSASNAFVDWHVLAGESNRVSYAGSCWAKVKIDGEKATVDLRNASVSISQIVGEMHDPLHRASLDGTITASRADALVESYLSDLDRLSHKNTTAMREPAVRSQTP